jgi:glycosyltransferase involved in cell wall biosynthesis
VEFIIINDGSRDRTEFIIADFVRKYPIENLSIINITNIGLSGARNKGIDFAKGDFIWFLDGDDALVHGSIKNIIQIIGEYPIVYLFAFEGYDFEDRELGVLKSNYSSANDWLIESFHRGVMLNTLISSSEYLKSKIQEGCYLSNACFYIIKKEILLNSGINFLPNAVYEDVPFTVHLFLYNHKSLIVNKRFILHRRRSGSITRSKLTKQHINSYYLINHELLKLTSKFKEFNLELFMLIEIYLKLGLRRTRDNGYSIFPYLFNFFPLFLVSTIKISSIRQEVYKNVKVSLKLLLG